jgi:shikimate kinase
MTDRPEASRSGPKLYLVGFMATGKTTIGQAAASRLGWRFVDLDGRIEAALGMTVSLIFRDLGEPAFRDAESAHLQAAADEPEPGIVATGGGVVLRDRNILTMRRSGVIVRLAAGADAVLERTEDGVTRPLLEGGDRHERVVELMRAREPRYALADVTVDTEEGEAAAVSAIVEIAAAVVAGRWSPWGCESSLGIADTTS